MARTPVVITRKHKKISKLGHLLAFAATGGTSILYTGAKAATNAGYNARTRQLQAEAEQPSPPPRRRGRREKVMFTEEEREYMARHVPGR